MPTKEQLIHLVDHGHDESVRLAQSLDAIERSESGSEDTWAMRDLLVHIGHWNRHLAERIAASRFGEEIEMVSDLDQANRSVFQQYEGESWEAIIQVVESGHAQLLTQLELCNEDELNDPAKYAWTNGSPLWRRIAGTAYVHAITHLVWAYLKRGDTRSAIRLSETEAACAAELDDSPTWQGTVAYNLACHYSQMGQREKSLEKLAVALQAYPDLAAWSQQDTDLELLHDDPDYLALLELASPPPQHINPALDREHLLHTLQAVLGCLEQCGVQIEYRLVGTGAALLHGVILPAGDIDLLVREREAVKIFAAALSGYTCKTAPAEITNARQFFAEFDVEGVDVGISTVEWETASDAVECLGNGPWVHYTSLHCGRFQVPTVALELRLATELGRRRKERYEPLLQHMQAHGCDRDLLKRGMDAQQVPASFQEQMMARLASPTTETG